MEPALADRRRGGVRTVQVTQEQVGPADRYLPDGLIVGRLDDAAVVVQQANVHAGERGADVPRAALAVDVNGAVHDRLGQAVPLHDALSGGAFDAKELPDRERCRTGHQQPRPADGLPGVPVPFDQVRHTVIHRGHAEHHGGAGGQLAAEGIRREPPHVPERATHPERPEHAQHQAVHVEQRQPVRQDVVRRPSPHLGQGVEVGRDGPSRDQHALGRTGCARGVEHEGGTLRVRLGGDRPRSGLQVHRLRPDRPQRLGKALRILGADHRPWGAVGDHVGDLRRADLGVDRNDGRPREQPGHHPDAGLERRRGPHGHPLLSDEPRRQGRGGVPKLPVGDRPAIHPDRFRLARIGDRRQQRHRPRRMPPGRRCDPPLDRPVRGMDHLRPWTWSDARRWRSPG